MDIICFHTQQCVEMYVESPYAQTV
jgi:hypothetical protein